MGQGGVSRGGLVGSYNLTRVLYLRLLSFVFLVAFLVAKHQNPSLLGDDGLLPARLHMARLNHSLGQGGPVEGFLAAPTVFWFVGASTVTLDWVATGGLVLSSVVLVTGSANSVILFMMWIGYFSIVTVGQRWYSFGWETQLLETAFLAIFAVPFVTPSRSRGAPPVPAVVVFANRWLIFRIMLGAGLIKLRGDACWRDLTCMAYHYETQPVPNPVARYLHHAPPLGFHKFETLVNHVVELVCPWFLLMPRPWRLACGVIQVGFQIVLIISGNLSFLNWLTIIPSILCFDDASLVAVRLFVVPKANVVADGAYRQGGSCRAVTSGIARLVRAATSVALALALCYLSVPVVRNLLALGSAQAMNTSFDVFKIVNTYGAFGSVTKARTEVVLQGTLAADPFDPGVEWREYEFPCKPGNVTRRPCTITPYHYRLDWLMWFAAFGNYQQHPWALHLVVKLLRGERHITGPLLAHDPFEAVGAGEPPKFIRAEHFRYRFVPPANSLGEAAQSYTQQLGEAAEIGDEETAYWHRERIGEWFPPLSLENPSLRQFVEAHGWGWHQGSKKGEGEEPAA